MSFLDTALEHAAMIEQWTLCTVEDIPDEQWAEQPGGLTNHPAWVVGHLTLACDLVTRKLGGTVDRNEAWYERFAPGAAPTASRADYPPKEELLAALSEAALRVRRTVRAGGEEAMARPIDDEQREGFFPTIGRWAAHILLAEFAFHAGQLSAWRRAKGMPSVFEVEGNLPRMMADALVP